MSFQLFIKDELGQDLYQTTFMIESNTTSTTTGELIVINEEGKSEFKFEIEPAPKSSSFAIILIVILVVLVLIMIAINQGPCFAWNGGKVCGSKEEDSDKNDTNDIEPGNKSPEQDVENPKTASNVDLQ